MAAEDAHELARPAVPQPDRLVERGGGHEPSVGREFDVVYQLLKLISHNKEMTKHFSKYSSCALISFFISHLMSCHASDELLVLRGVPEEEGEVIGAGHHQLPLGHRRQQLLIPAG